MNSRSLCGLPGFSHHSCVLSFGAFWGIDLIRNGEQGTNKHAKTFHQIFEKQRSFMYNVVHQYFIRRMLRSLGHIAIIVHSNQRQNFIASINWKNLVECNRALTSPRQNSFMGQNRKKNRKKLVERNFVHPLGSLVSESVWVRALVLSQELCDPCVSSTWFLHIRCCTKYCQRHHDPGVDCFNHSAYFAYFAYFAYSACFAYFAYFAYFTYSAYSTFYAYSAYSAYFAYSAYSALDKYLNQ